jgi:hypothetical protein
MDKRFATIRPPVLTGPGRIAGVDDRAGQGSGRRKTAAENCGTIPENVSKWPGTVMFRFLTIKPFIRRSE